MATSFDSSLPLIVPFPKCLLKVILKGNFEMNVENVLVHIIMVIILKLNGPLDCNLILWIFCFDKYAFLTFATLGLITHLASS
jgi:hypothetical protein